LLDEWIRTLLLWRSLHTALLNMDLEKMGSSLFAGDVHGMLQWKRMPVGCLEHSAGKEKRISRRGFFGYAYFGRPVVRLEFPFQGIWAKPLALLRSEFWVRSAPNTHLDTSFLRDLILNQIINDNSITCLFLKIWNCVVFLRYYLQIARTIKIHEDIW
jgi:hypothetical protein